MEDLGKLKLTALEKQFIEILIPMLYAEAGFTDVEVKDMSEKMNVSIDSAKGVLGSLVKKGIITTQSHESFDFVKSGRKMKRVVTTREFIILSSDYYCLHPKWK